MKTIKFLLVLFIVSMFCSGATTPSNPKDINYLDRVTGKLVNVCREPGRRPSEQIWNKFADIVIIKDSIDWTISGIATRDIGGEYPFVIDILKSQNKFEFRAGSNYPWTAKLSDTLAVSYRISETKLIVRAINIPSSKVSYCVLSGMITAEIK